MPKRKRSVYCIQLDQTFNSIQEAALELELHEKCIWRCCNYLQKKTDGLSFIYNEGRDMMEINKTALAAVNVTYEEYVEWSISNHKTPTNKSTIELFFKLIRTDKLVRDKKTKKLKKRVDKKDES